MKNLLLMILTGLMVYGCSNNNQNTTSNEAQSDDLAIAITNDMENALSGVPSWINEATVVKMPEGIAAHSGEYVTRVTEQEVYSYAYRETLSNINSKLPTAVIVEGWVYSPVDNSSLSVVVDINENGKSIIWKSYVLTDAISELNKWNEFKARFAVDQPIKPEYQLKVFAYGGKKTAYFDDLKISFEY